MAHPRRVMTCRAGTANVLLCNTSGEGQLLGAVSFRIGGEAVVAIEEYPEGPP